MNQKAASELAEKAKPFIGRTIHVHVVDKNNDVKESIECTFDDWGAIAMRENGGEAIIQLTAKLVEKDSEKIHRAPLEVVVREFERDDQLKK